ncbi:MAG TPA: hypothetical protein VGC98_13350 [Thermoleophilaceae bacterium]
MRLISYVEGHVPERLADACVRGPVVEGAPDAVLLRLPRVGRFLVRADVPAAVERAPGATDADIECFIRGPVAAAAALLRGALPLHAAAVSIGGRAIAIAGISGSGKSAVAAAMALRGHAVLADAVTVVDGLVRPIAPKPVLWPDMVEELGLDPSHGEVVRPALAKRAFQLGPRPEAAPLQTVVILLSDPARTRAASAPLSGWRKTSALLSACWYRRVVGPMGLEPRRFQSIAALAPQVDVIHVVRPRDHCSPVALAALVEEALA